MADNVGYTAGTGTTIAADDVGGVLHQRVKIGVGVDGVAVDVSSTNPMPVQLSGANTVDVNNFPATQAVTGPLTNAELRAASFEVEDKNVWWMLQRIFAMLTSPPGFDSSQKRHRNTAVIESGTVTTVGTVSSVTTVTTVSGLTNIDGRNGAMLINQTNLSAWTDCVRARIT